MKVCIVLFVLVAFTAADSLTPAELEMLEVFDYDALLNNAEQRKIVFDCLLGKGGCGDYQKIAELSMKSLESKCAECSPAQKTKFDYVLKQLHDNYESVYNELMKKVAAKKE